MKNIALLIILGLFLVSCDQIAEQQLDSSGEKQTLADVESIRDGVFIHITEGANDPHRVLMPLKMATLMASDKDVIVYMDIHAVELLVKGAKDLSFADFESFQTYIKQLTDANVGVYACPTCLKVAGFTPEDLLEGVQIAQKDKFFDFTKGRILTLDY
ncbi:MAG: DsrE family protein [Bacteroidales bacterium]|nr:DsrE family protein [Bacteroidales bacterium]MCF8405497.1 DsrE family protein [Bacteroidales bacterium]